MIIRSVSILYFLVIIKWYEYAQSSEGKHGIEILVEPDEGHPVEQEGNAAQPRGQSVDAVDEVDGIDDENRNENGERDANPRRHGMDEQPFREGRTVPLRQPPAMMPQTIWIKNLAR